MERWAASLQTLRVYPFAPLSFGRVGICGMGVGSFGFRKGLGPRVLG